MNRIVMSLFIAAAAVGADATVTSTDSVGCPIGGTEAAPLTIQEFVDLECSYCAKGAETLDEVLRHYPGRVRVVTRQLPLSAHGEDATKAAKAVIAVCLQSPTLASNFQHEIFTHQDQLKKEGEQFLYDTAQSVGADVEKMKQDMNDEIVAKQLATDAKDAAALGFKGTPAFVIGTETLMGAEPYEKFKEIVDRQLGVPGLH